ncbi:murein tripeptide amidase MpaA [Salmonella enterica]|nr:murein tripeptide amidase MpaA [Salmonella enterica]
MTVTRPRAERGAFPPGTEHYGRSLLGAPLIWFPAPAADRESGLALCQLIHRLQPAWVVSFHDPLACIEDPRRSELGEWLADAFALPLVTSVGYETPGSFGSWCADLNLHCITAEFPPVSADEASEKYLLAMSNLLRWHPKDGVDPS